MYHKIPDWTIQQLAVILLVKQKPVQAELPLQKQPDRAKCFCKYTANCKDFNSPVCNPICEYWMGK